MKIFNLLPVIGIVLFIIPAFTSPVLLAQCTDITGRVFTDFDEDGIYDTPVEVGLESVIVNAYDNDNNLVGTDNTDTNGLYSINTSGANATTLCADGSYCYRVEFTLPANHVAWAADAGMGAEVQRVCDSNCTANLASYSRYDYCEDTPRLTTSCYIDGDNTGAEDVLISFDFVNPTGAPSHEAVENQIGTTYGLAYQAASNSLFAGAFQKRFAGYGSGSPGSIYIVSNPKDGTTSGVEFLDLNTLFGSNVAGVDPHDFTVIAPIKTYGTAPNEISYAEKPVDQLSFNTVGRISLGDLELSEDHLTLHAVNLNNRSLYSIPLGTDPENPVAPTTSAQVTVTDLVNAAALPGLPAGISNQELIPFGLEVKEDIIYIGYVTNGEVNGIANMYGLVYSLEVGTGTFTKALQFPLNYTRGCGFGSSATCYGDANWNAWLTTNVYPATVNFSAFFEEAYPQPILADLEFDVRGNLVISLRDRWGDQGGYAAPKPDYSVTNDDRTHSDAFGDILYATTNNDGTWSLNIADFTDSSLSLSTAAAGVAELCPDAENFFGNDCYNSDGFIHEETNFSGITVHLPSDQVASISMDPDINAFSTGIDWHSLETGNQTGSYQIITNAIANAAGEFGKGNGLGDLELLCSEAPIEVGNYVWYDEDEDGIQDPCEAPMNGVTVELYDDLGTLVGTATTGATGRYNFGGVGNVNMTGGNILTFEENYELRIDLANAQTAATTQGLINGNLLLTDINAGADRANSDASMNVAGTMAVTAFTTGRAGDNNHNYDFGFFECESITNPSADAFVCSGEDVTTISVSTSEIATDGIRFVYFTTAQTADNMYAGGTDIALVTPATGSASISNTTFPVNTSNANVIYYVYAVLNPAPTTTSCRPFQEIEITIYPAITASPDNGSVCNENMVTISGNAADGSGSYTTHQWTDLGTSTASGYSLSNATSPSLNLDANGATAGVVNVSYTVTDDNTCSVTENATITILALPNASPATVVACETIQGSGFASFDLTSVDNTVTGGLVGATVEYFTDAALTTSISDPTIYTAGSGTVYAQVTDAQSCMSTASAITLTVATISPSLSQIVCYNNYTDSNEGDDYFTITANATASNPGGSNQFEVILNANADGTGGTVLGTSTYGIAVVIGSGKELSADGLTDYILTFRDADINECHAEENTGIVQECSDCPTQICLPITLSIKN